MQGNANITNLDLMAIGSIINKILFVTCYEATNGEEEKKFKIFKIKGQSTIRYQTYLPVDVKVNISYSATVIQLTEVQ